MANTVYSNTSSSAPFQWYPYSPVYSKFSCGRLSSIASSSDISAENTSFGGSSPDNYSSVGVESCSWEPTVIRRQRRLAPLSCAPWPELRDAIRTGEFKTVVNTMRMDDARLSEAIATDPTVRQFILANALDLAASWCASTLGNAYLSADRGFQLSFHASVTGGLEQLMFHQFGNIVVSKILSATSTHRDDALMDSMREKLAEPGMLSKAAMNKSASHVLEAYIANCPHDSFTNLVKQVVLASPSPLVELTDSPIGNYPMQQMMRRLRAELDAGKPIRKLYRRVIAVTQASVLNSEAKFSRQVWSALIRSRRVQ